MPIDNSPPAPILLLRTLGAPTLHRLAADGQEALLLGAGKPLAVLTYLALAPRRAAGRDLLVDLLWANAEPERARQTLRQTLSQLRVLLGADALASRGHDVTLTWELTTDRDAYLGAIRSGDLGKAVDLYVGDFLASFAVPGGGGFERWAAEERDRLRASYLRALGLLVREQLERARPREAEPLARALRDADPFDQGSWRLLIEVLLSAGGFLEAAVEADAFERFLEAEECEAEPPSRAMLRRARHAPPQAPAAAADIAGDLIGREPEFARILDCWGAARRERAQVVQVIAPAGIGKTRLLSEVHRRFRATGIRAVRERAMWGERALPYAFAAALARALSTIPGGAAVSPASASALVALEPALSGAYRTGADPAIGEEALRRRAAALLELVRAVSDEQPIAVLLDDVHWADAASWQVLAGVLGRLGGERILVVVASRLPAGTSLAGALTLELSSLGAEQVDALLSSLATLHDAPWRHDVVAALHQATAGSPLLLLETLRLLREEGQLVINDGAWHCADSVAVLRTLQTGSALVRRVTQLDPRSRELALLLAVAGGALPDSDIVLACGGNAANVDVLLADLEQRGFVARTEGHWEVAHDQIGGALIEQASPEGLRAAHRLLGLALAGHEGLGTIDYQRVARHLVHGGEDVAVGRLFRRWRGAARGRGDYRSDRTLARELLADLATPERVRALLASRPLLHRAAFGRPRLAAGFVAGAIALWLGAGLAMAAARPYRLALVVPPITASQDLGLVPAPVVEVRDWRERLVSSATDTVHVAVVGGRALLRGATAVAAVNGRATFSDLLAPRVEQPMAVRFWARGILPVQVRIDPDDDASSSLRLVSAMLNGQQLGPSARRLDVAAGDSITGTVQFRYTSAWGAASVMLGAVPTWGDRRTDFVTVGPLVTPARDLVRHASLAILAPRRPGCYHLIFAFQAEGNMEQIASGTNWSVGHPVWGDGNDVAGWSNEQLAEANRAGAVRSWLLRRRARGTRAEEYWVPATVIDVAVHDGHSVHADPCAANGGSVSP